MQGLLNMAKIPPGAELATRLAAIDLSELDDDYDVIEVVAAWDRLKSWVDAGQLAAVAEFARRPLSIGLTPDVTRAKRGPLGSVRRSNPDDELAARLSISSGVGRVSARFGTGSRWALDGHRCGTGCRRN